MPGPRKVRVFRDSKKSPNWYVEWRDTSGRRHCESCGPHEKDALERARQIKDELRQSRLAGSGRPARRNLELPGSKTPLRGPNNPSGTALGFTNPCGAKIAGVRDSG